MNKLLIGLLVIAAGAGAFFFFNQRTCDKPAQETINKELIIGKWKTESYQPVMDPVQPKFQYDFQKDGIAFRSLNDTVKADTVSYSWKTEAHLLIKENAADSVGAVFTVLKLTQDSLLVQGSDSVFILLTKTK